ncbi:MAG: hypothetical protein HC904_14780 [Blastochloris sp.]|nr:hypothetical protein [Blastochloris sp.]
MALTLLAFGLFILAVSIFEFPLTRLLTTAIAGPLVVLLLLSFLPEIRRAYEDAKLFNFFGPPRKKSQQLLSQLAPALFEMCQRRIGAILVFPRRMDWRAHVNGGEAYDARLTHSLLLALFHPQSPRHDGAAIIEGDRICQIGALLPLSQSEDHPESWGTRHLAALGLSEKGDADILIVSEERGTLSHASQGVIRQLPVPSPETLEESLGHILGNDIHPSKPWFRSGVSITLWAASIAIAMLAMPVLKIFQNAGEEALLVQDVPVSFSNLPDNLYVERIKNPTVRVYIQAPINLTQLPVSNLGVVIDLKGMTASSAQIVLQKEMLRGAPLGWKVAKYEPENIEFQIFAARQLDLKPEIEYLGLAPHLRLDRIDLDPPSFQVSAKDSRIEKNRRLKTAPISLAKITEPGTYSFATTVELPASIAFLKPTQSPVVQATVTISSAKNVKKR